MAERTNKTSDVFGINRDIPLNYVYREDVDKKLIDNLTRDKHVVIFGSSKQGKTCLRKKCLQDDDYIIVHCSNKWGVADINSNILKRAGFELTQSTKVSTTGKAKVIASLKAAIFGIGAQTGGELETSQGEETVKAQLELDIEDVNDIIDALKSIDFKKYIVLEDFHYLPEETQVSFAVELKAFHENSDFCFIIVGVWLDENRLIVYNGDLTGRLISINADKWHRAQLQQVISDGEALLNIQFAEKFKDELLENCFDNVYIVQEACYRACAEQDITETQDTTATVGKNKNVNDIVQSIVNEQSGRYNAFITSFARGFQETELEMYKWILYPVLTTPAHELENGLRYQNARKILQSTHPRGNELNPGNITQALQASASLQIKREIKPIIMDYDRTNLVLQIVDRGFLIWLKYQATDDLLELAELPTSDPSE